MAKGGGIFKVEEDFKVARSKRVFSRTPIRGTRNRK
jgi:hypothetical protein